jgi:hypothetical protein
MILQDYWSEMYWLEYEDGVREKVPADTLLDVIRQEKDEIMIMLTKPEIVALFRKLRAAAPNVTAEETIGAALNIYEGVMEHRK